MTAPELKITLVQANLVWEDVEANLNHLKEILTPVTDTDIIVLPEMFSTGFSMNAESLAQESYTKGITFMKEIASEKNCAVCGSLICFEAGKYYNRFTWFDATGNLIIYNKRHLFSLGDENNHYFPGSEILIIEYKGWKIRPLICYDLRFPVWSRNTKENPYDLLLYVANWPEKRIHQWGKLLPARAIENLTYVAAVNRIGVDGNGYAYTGMSMMVDFKGEATILEENSEIVRTFILDKKDLEQYRIQFPFLNDGDSFYLK